MIDLIFTNIIDIKASGTLSVTIADHLPIYIIKKKSKEKPKKVIVKKRNYKTYNAVDFTNLIESDWRWANYWAITDCNNFHGRCRYLISNSYCDIPEGYT